jgi:hypothetical protein
MRVGVIGNSHLAAFKLGWELQKAKCPDFSMTFFGSPTTSLRFLKVANGGLWPTDALVTSNLKWTSEGLDHIPGDLDAYICVGMGFSFVHLIALMQSHRIYRDYEKNDEGQQLISEAFLRSAMESTLKNSVAIRLMRLVREVTSAPIYYSPNPYGSVSVLDSSQHTYFRLEKTRAEIFAYYKRSLAELLGPLTVIPFEQPSETIVGEMFTKEIFSKGSVKLKQGMRSIHGDDDHFHMNADFGRLSLQEILARC